MIFAPTCTSLHLVLTKGSMTPDTDSVLNNVTIDHDGNQVILTCHFRTDISHSLHVQCIVVCRSSTKLDLMVKNYTIGTKFPQKFYIPETGNYSVAVFGWKDKMIEPHPQKLVKFTQGKWLSSGCYQEPIGAANAALQRSWATDVIHGTNCVGHTVNIHV